MPNAGTRSSVRLVTIPRAPSAITTPPNRSPSPSRLSVTTSPPAVTICRADTAVARLPLAFPEPCVPVAHAPAIEMCGSEPRLRSAQPAPFSGPASSPYRRPALTVTVARAASIWMTFGRPATETRSPGESAMRLNECPVPMARTRALTATMRCNSARDAGRWNRSALKVTFPAQFVSCPVIRSRLASLPPRRRALFQERGDAFPGGVRLRGRGHHLDGEPVGVGLAQVELGVQGALADPFGFPAAAGRPGEQ